MKTDNDTRTAVLTLLAIPTATIMLIVVMLPLGLFTAWAMQKMYGWFILPLGAPTLNLWHVFGLNLIINRYLYKPGGDNKKFVEQLIAGIVATLLTLLLGFMVKGQI